MAKLLLITSSPMVKRLVERFLPNHVIVTESHAKPALQIILSHEFDVILLGEAVDHGTPLVLLDALPHEPHLYYPILYLQSSGNRELAFEALRMGARESVDLGESEAIFLAAAVDRLLRQQELFRENQRMQQELQRSNSELTQFASAVAHDLKEPLRKINSFGAMLEEELQGVVLSDSAKHYLERMQNSASRMTDLLSSLLDVARVSSVPKCTEWNSIQVGLDASLETLEHRIQETKATVLVLSELPLVECYPAMISQLMQNLIGNALKYRHAERSPVIEVDFQRNDIGGTLIVRDNGIGFAPEQAESIFGIFRRLHGRNSPYEGHGVGLAICLRIAEKMGGTIRAIGQIGMGAEFQIQLPEVRWSPTGIVDL